MNVKEVLLSATMAVLIPSARSHALVKIFAVLAMS